VELRKESLFNACCSIIYLERDKLSIDRYYSNIKALRPCLNRRYSRELKGFQEVRRDAVGSSFRDIWSEQHEVWRYFRAIFKIFKGILSA